MYDVYGLGNALVDMEYQVDDAYLRDQGIAKGHMTLVDDDRLSALTRSLSGLEAERMSGGSAANTVIAVQAFGGRAYYSCRVAGDETGAFFLSDLNTAGVATNPHDADAAGVSGRCLVLVTPDAERSMNTFLGVSSELDVSSVNDDALKGSRFFYTEGYLSSSPVSTEAAIRCRELAEGAGVATAVSLSDPSMIEFFRDGLTAILGNGVQHLFCNEEEALSWAGTDRIDVAVHELGDIAPHLNITLGARGSLAVENKRQTLVPGVDVKPVDTVGAGDIYAGACLYGWSAGMNAVDAARFANHCAAHLVTRTGARLRSLKEYRELLDAFH